MSIYGSVVSGVPSSVNYEFTKIADASVPVTFFVRGNHPVNLALVSSVQNSCRSTFFVDVEAGNTIKHSEFINIFYIIIISYKINRDVTNVNQIIIIKLLKLFFILFIIFVNFEFEFPHCTEQSYRNAKLNDSI